MEYTRLQLLLTRARYKLQRIFLYRWKELYGNEWKNTKKDGEYFSKGIGLQIYQFMKKPQQKSLARGNSEEWDTTLLVTILNSLPFYEKEMKKIIDDIANVRNSMHHLASLEVPMFHNHWAKLSKILVQLGDSQDEIDKLLITPLDQQPSNSLSLQKAEEFGKMANEFFKVGNFQAAIDEYSKAIVLPGLLSQDRTILYSKRSTSYLRLYQMKKVDQELIYSALSDAKMSRREMPSWYKSYYGIGRVYEELGNLDKAKKNYEKALLFQPNDEEIKKCLADVTSKIGKEQRHEHLDPRFTPGTKEEKQKYMLDSVKDFLGEISMEKLLKTEKEIEKWIPGNAYVTMGHKYRNGSQDCEQDYFMAASYFGKSVQLGNAEGMYNLSQLTADGKGVKKDYKLALFLLESAAEQLPMMNVNGMELRRVGVWEAQHSLGLYYENGIYVDKDYSYAAYWYERAISNGSGPSANNLGLMYINGKGVDFNLKKAESLFELAWSHRDYNAGYNMVDLQIQLTSPEKALMWHERSIEKGNLTSRSRDRQIRSDCKMLIAEFEKTGVPAWEKSTGRDSNQLSQSERMDRYMQHKFPGSGKIMEAMNGLKISSGPFTSVSSNPYVPDTIASYAEKGGEFAKRLFESSKQFHEALEYLQKIPFEKIKFIQTLGKAYRIEPLVCMFPNHQRQKVLDILSDFIARNKETSTLDEDARIAYCHLKGEVPIEGINCATTSLAKYPKCAELLELRGCLYNFNRQYELGVIDLSTVQQLAPDKYDLHFLKGLSLRSWRHEAESISEFKKFLSKATKDHRLIPRTHYAMGTIYVVQQNMEKAMECYRLGISSEAHQLPFFLPYDSNDKNMLSAFGEIKGKVNPPKKQNPLEDAVRVELVKEFRKFRKEAKEKSNMGVVSRNTVVPPRKQKAPSSLIGLKAIYLSDMDTTKDRVFEGYVLTGTIIEPAVLLTGAFFLFEDEHKRVRNLVIYAVGDNLEEINNRYPVGCNISVINPYIRIAADMKPTIRVDDPDSIFFTGKNKENMCSYCGKENATKKCGRCNKARYCDKECQLEDWKKLGHQNICFQL